MSYERETLPREDILDRTVVELLRPGDRVYFPASDPILKFMHDMPQEAGWYTLLEVPHLGPEGNWTNSRYPRLRSLHPHDEVPQVLVEGFPKSRVGYNWFSRYRKGEGTHQTAETQKV